VTLVLLEYQVPFEVELELQVAFLVELNSPEGEVTLVLLEYQVPLEVKLEPQVEFEDHDPLFVELYCPG